VTHSASPSLRSAIPARRTRGHDLSLAMVSVTCSTRGSSVTQKGVSPDFWNLDSVESSLPEPTFYYPSSHFPFPSPQPFIYFLLTTILSFPPILSNFSFFLSLRRGLPPSQQPVVYSPSQQQPVVYNSSQQQFVEYNLSQQLFVAYKPSQ